MNRRLAGTREGHLGELFAAAALRDVELSTFSAHVEYATFDEWWEPFTEGVGPAGGFVASLGADRRAELRETCRRLLPGAPFVITARAWASRGVVHRP